MFFNVCNVDVLHNTRFRRKNTIKYFKLFVMSCICGVIKIVLGEKFGFEKNNSRSTYFIFILCV